MFRLMRHVLLAAAALIAAGVHAQAADPAKGPPAGFVAPAEPRADETNADRTRSQPGNNAPVWRAVRESGHQEGVVNLPGAEQGVLIQPLVEYPGSRYASAGEAWRQVRNRWIIPYGGSLVLIAALAMALFYWRKGPLGHSNSDGPPVIERFTPFERASHWANAAAFVVLAVSGLVMAFGKFFLLPVIGATLFGWLTYALKTAHNFAGPLFAVSLVVTILTFARDNLPRRGDGRWLVRAGGLLSGGDEIPSHRFNGGEKVLFWVGVFLVGLVVVASGLVLDKLVPGLAYLRGDMQIANMIHGVAAVLMIVMFMGHIYIGTIGMRGAYKAMKTGYVDEAWAREHHLWWAEDIRAGKIPARRSSEPAPNLKTAKEGA